MQKILINVSKLTHYNWNEEREEWDKIINIIPKKINNYTTLEEIVAEAKEIKRQIINIIKDEGFETMAYCHIGNDVNRSLLFELYDIIDNEIPQAVQKINISYENNIKKYKFNGWLLHH